MWKNRKKVSFHNNLLIICVLIPLFFVNACSGLNRSDKPATTSWWLEPYTDYSFARSDDPALLLDLSVTVVPPLKVGLGNFRPSHFSIIFSDLEIRQLLMV